MRLRRSFWARFALVGWIASILLSCSPEETPRAKDGVLDLRGASFAGSSPSIPLEGEWKARWDRLVPPARMDVDTGRIGTFDAPGTWNDRILDGRAHGPFGCATFSLVVLVPDSAREVGLTVPDVLTAGRLWANGALVSENGKPGTEAGSTVARAENAMAPVRVEPRDGRIALVYQISNFESERGGLSHVPRIGSLQGLEREDSLRVGKEVFLIGVLFLLGVYHLLLWAMRRHDLTAGPLALFCVLWAGRFLVEQGTGQRLLTGLVPGLPYALVAKLEVVPFYLTVAVLMHFFANYFPGIVHRRVLAAGYGFSIALVLSVVFTPPWFFGRFLALGGLINVAGVVYMAFVFATAIRKGCEGAILLAAGCGLFSACGINDLLQALELVRTGYFLDWGVLALACANSLVVARRYSNAYDSLEANSEELRRMDRVKDDFLANTSHELRTPLHGIVGMSESILAGAGKELPEGVRGDVLAIAGSAKRLTNLVNEILDFSKLRHGDISLEKRPLDCAPLVAQVVANFRPAVRRKGMALRSELASDLPRVFADQDRLVQILFNLVGNAVKFTDAGEVVVSLRTRDGEVEVEVRDTGIGIEPAARDRIFDAFVQGDAPQRGGTGLGLSITRRLVELHGGKLSVDSEPGLGSAFRFMLPVARIPEGDLLVESGGDRARLQDPMVESAEEDLVPPESPSLHGAGATVLAVDDEPVNLRILRSHLASRGYQVVCADHGRDILERIEREKPALVLLDVMMPGHDGFEVCQEIRTRHSPSELPVLFVTARNRMDDLLRGYAAGGNDYIPKPFLREELLARVDQHLRQRKTYGPLLEESALAGEIMQAVLQLWTELTRGNRADFAEASGLWTVRADPDGWRRTQTLDKYLDPHKTPRQPRWSKVQESARYVLELAERDGRGRKRAGQLRELVEQLKRGEAGAG